MLKLLVSFKNIQNFHGANVDSCYCPERKFFLYINCIRWGGGKIKFDIMKYSSLINNLSLSYSKVQFVNLSMSAIGAMGSSCISLLSLLNDLHR